MPTSELSTEAIVAELISRDGVEYEQVCAGREIAYTPPKDAYFIVVPPDAMPHNETIKEKKEAIQAEFMALLMERAKGGEQVAAEMLLQLLKG